MVLSIIIPIYNEGNTLLEFLRLVDSIDLNVVKELVIINDHSTDNTSEIIDSFPFSSQYQVIHQATQQGKGAALHRGIQIATGDIIVIQDADFEYNITDLQQLISPILNDRADIVFGNRFHSHAVGTKRTVHYFANKIITTLSNQLSGLRVNDMETCYKVFKAEIIKNINLSSPRFGFEPEVTAKLAQLNLRLEEQAISYHPRSYRQGKKITWRDGIAALWHILYFNLWTTNHKKNFSTNMPVKYIIK